MAAEPTPTQTLADAIAAPAGASALKDRLLLALSLLGGLAITVFGHQVLRDAETLRFKEAHGAAAQQVVDVFREDLARTVEAVRGAGLLLETQPQLGREAFNRHAQRLAERLPGLSLLEWQPVVPHAQLAAFEAAARKQGLAQYRVVEPGPQPGTWVAPAVRAEHVPVLFGWPEQMSPLGLDLSFDKQRMASKLEAARRGLPIASATFSVIHRQQDAAPVLGLAVSAAVHERDSATASPRLLGYVAGVLELPALLKRTAESARALDLALQVSEGEATPNRPVFEHGRVEPAAAMEIHQVDVAGRPWQLRLAPLPSFAAQRATHYANGVLVLGLLATLLLAGVVWATQRRGRALARSQALRLEESLRLQNIVAGTGVGTWEHDFRSGETTVSERWLALTGRDGSGWQPGPDYHWKLDCHPDDMERVEAALRAHLSGECAQYEAEYRQRHQRLGWLWVSARGKVLKRDREGRPQLIAGMVINIDALKQAEARVLELNGTLEQRIAERSRQLEAAMQKLYELQDKLSRTEARAALSTLVASVSHELSTPMSNALIGNSSMSSQTEDFLRRLDNGSLRRSELQAYLEQMRSGAQLSTRNLERAVELLGHFRQVAADQASEQRRDFDLKQMVEEIIETLSPTLKRRPHRLLLDIPPGIEMDSYPGPLGQIIINLVNNAYLHAFDEGSVGEVRVLAQRQGEQVQLQVIDNGHGMNQDTLDQLFRPFFSTKIGKGGTGLGMAIVQTLCVKTLGGSVSAESQPGAGCCITLRLPLRAPLRDGR